MSKTIGKQANVEMNINSQVCKQANGKLKKYVHPCIDG